MPRPRPAACRAMAKAAKPKPASCDAKAEAARPKPAACPATALASNMDACCENFVPRKLLVAFVISSRAKNSSQGHPAKAKTKG